MKTVFRSLDRNLIINKNKSISISKKENNKVSDYL
jgi:hypothetical protein